MQAAASLYSADAASDGLAFFTASIAARTDLANDEINLLLDLALATENRMAIGDEDLRAFGSRFGTAEEEALRAAAAEETLS